ncbi:MAG: glycosyltransferase family 9 protein [Massilia sp.]
MREILTHDPPPLQTRIPTHEPPPLHSRRYRRMNLRPLLKRLTVRNVVIFRALQLGDMLCAVPALRALRAALPCAQITLVGLPWAQQFADRFSSYIDGFIAFPGHAALPEQPVQRDQLIGFYQSMHAQEFSLALQMHGDGRVTNGIVKGFRARANAGFAASEATECDRLSYFPYPDRGAEPLRLLNLVSLLGAPPAGAQLEFPLLPADWDELNGTGLAVGLVPGSYMCIHPGASVRDKCWPPARFAQVADQLAFEFGLSTVITGSGKEAELAGEVAARMRSPAINAAAPISIGAMAALMSGARLLICNDTGVSHIAAGLRLKSVVVFSKADIHRWAPLDRRMHRSVWDPNGDHADEVVKQARLLLAGVPY